MIKITKGREPDEWTEERNTPGITYETAHKDALRLALLEEQGGLCGYCMRRVSFVAGTQTDTRIEHLKPRTLSLAEGKSEETLAYGNMILCCNGDIDGSKNLICTKTFQAERNRSQDSFSCWSEKLFYLFRHTAHRV